LPIGSCCSNEIQGIRLEPLLEAISGFLDEQREVIESVRQDLVRGLKQPDSGRHGLTATQVLRSLVLMRVKNWDYRELRERIADGLTLRQFTDFYCSPVPKHDAFQRGFIRLAPQTLKAINDLVVRAAVELGLEDGAKLRVDTTVVQTDIHHPTDNTLLWDVVRVVTRLVRRLAKALELRRIKGFCDRTRSARRRMYEIQRMTTRQRQEQQTRTYRVLIDIAEEVVGNARAGLEKTRTMRGKGLFADMTIAELRRQIGHFCGLGDRVIDQARRRVLFGEQLATDEKIYSIFEPHTDLIKRGKVRTPVEFGHKVFLAESAQGLITQYEVLKGNPPDRSTWHLPFSVTDRPLAKPRSCMARIVASSASRTWPRASAPASRWCAFRSVVARGRHDVRRTRGAWSSRIVSAFAPASRDASGCYSGAEA